MRAANNYLKKILNENDTIVIASSGGPDSMCLTDVLLKLRDKLNLQLIIAHVNHNIRKNSIKEKEFVENYAKTNNIIFEYMKIENYNQNNFHDDARNIRYNFFMEIYDKYQAKYLMTAHHANDLVETILMRFVRGSNLKGYSGFIKDSYYKNMHIIRPLINIEKESIIKYNKENNIEYVNDESNDSDKYTRNRYRHHIVPLLYQENNNLYHNILEYNEEINGAYNFIDKYAKNKMTEINKNDKINIDLLKKEDIIIQKEIIRNLLSSIYGDDIKLISEIHVKEIIKLINNEFANKELCLPNNYVVKKRYQELLIEKNSENIEFNYKLDEIVETNNWVIKKISGSDDKSNYVIRINSKEVSLPIIIRNKKDGDYIEIKGLNGRKKIKDIFIDEKINKDERSNYPVVTDSEDKILWLPGIKKSKFDKEKDEIYDILLKYERKEEENE